MRNLIGLAAAITAAASLTGFTSAAIGAPTANLKAQALESGIGYVQRTQGIYFGFSVGRPPRHGYYRRHYRRPYRSYYYGRPGVTYYSRPYVVERRGYYRDPDAIARCASRFRSFNAHTGTYITYGGEERLCPYLR